jgi:hypothetical protein
MRAEKQSGSQHGGIIVAVVPDFGKSPAGVVY